MASARWRSGPDEHPIRLTTNAAGIMRGLFPLFASLPDRHHMHAGFPTRLPALGALAMWAGVAASAQPWLPPQPPTLDPPAIIRDGDVTPRRSALVAPAAAAATTAYSHGEPTAEEQYMLELVNRARANPAAEGLRLRSTTDPAVLAAYRFFQVDVAAMAAQFATYPARPPLAFNANLIAAARAHSQDMARNNFQGHTGSNGSSMVNRVEAAGYTGWNALAENVYAYAESVFHGHAGFNADWGVPSLGHRMNIMNFSSTGPVYTEVGIGIVPESAPGTGVGPLVVTEDFGRRSGQFFVVGVVFDDANRDGFYGVGEGVGGVTVATSEGNSAITSTSGGYAIPLSGGSGSITVRAEGTALGAVNETVVALAGSNVKVDFIAGTAAAPGVDPNQHGLTGSWYEPATSGQGFEVEVFPDQSGPGSGSIFVSWFTYDTVVGGAERQRWYTLAGTVATGQPSAALTIYQNVGGNFNALPVTNAQAVGTATLRFATCTSGQLTYSFTDGSGRSGSIDLARLTQNVTCSTTSARPTNADFAFSGNWYDPATSGQGLTIDVNPGSGTVFAAWYTYAPTGVGAGAAGQRWYTAQPTSFTPGARSIPVTLYQTTGGVFDQAAVPGMQTVAVGTGTLAFQNCSAATLSFTFTGGSSSGSSGTIALKRVGPVPKGCV